eukprot:CAMPEP_0175179098 /NCGR_PEP_ID=MMETSP0087-20121206/35321_1 /TAXON_ID=136419 /ORGANISM="Unknown Unknown, Strain D1" /LENGTH=669 /DNA_ID=CAMNT_0016471285 /DNA_START=268 /DNA_END=2276 /DNA_ORIENTATION=+
MCIQCDQIEGGDCSEGKLVAKKGYRRAVAPGSSVIVTEFVKCGQEGVCLQDGKCADGYTGQLCSQCTVNASNGNRQTGRIGTYGCAECGSSATVAVSIVGVVVLLLLVAVLFVMRTVRTAMDEDNTLSLTTKIILSTMQFNSVAANIDYRWEFSVQAFKKMLGLQQSVSTVGMTFLSASCFLSPGSSTSPFWVECCIFLFAPFAVPVVPLFFFLPRMYYYLRKDGDQVWRQRTKDLYFTTVIVIFFLIHPVLTYQAFQIFNCRNLGTKASPSYWLVKDLSIKCWSAQHTKFFGLAFPMFALYTIGIPAAGLYVNGQEPLVSEPGQRQKKVFLFVQRLQDGIFFLILVTFVVVFWSEDPATQGLLCILVSVSALLLHNWASPFVEKKWNRLEGLSLVVAFVTFFAGQLLFRIKSSTTTATMNFFSFFTDVAVVVNITFFVFLLGSLLYTLNAKVQSKVQLLIAKCKKKLNKHKAPTFTENPALEMASDVFTSKEIASDVWSTDQDGLGPLLYFPVKKAGMLAKVVKKTVRGNQRSALWQQRYFVLYEDALVYYKSKNDPKALGVIPVHTITSAAPSATDKNGCVFDIQLSCNGSGSADNPDASTTFVLSAPSPAEMESWIDILVEQSREGQDLKYEWKGANLDDKFWKNANSLIKLMCQIRYNRPAVGGT